MGTWLEFPVCGKVAAVLKSIGRNLLMKNRANPFISAIRYIVPPLLLVSSGFILCMHWFLLMADTHVEGITSDVIPESILAIIRNYYTVVFGPMTWLIKVFILLMLLTMTLQLFIREISGYLRWLIFLTNTPLVFQGVFRIIPMVDQFILNIDTPLVQSQMARTVHNAHVLSAWGVAFMIVLQLIVIIQLQRKTDRK